MISMHDLKSMPAGEREVVRRALIALHESNFWSRVLQMNRERLFTGSVEQEEESLAKDILNYRNFKTVIDSLDSIGGQLHMEQTNEQE